MDAAPEGEMSIRRTRDIKAVRICELGSVPVGRCDPEMDVGARRQRHATKLDSAGQLAVADLNRAFEPEEFLIAPSIKSGFPRRRSH